MNAGDSKIVSAITPTTSTTTKTTNTIVVDYTNIKRDITHYIAVTIWVGWFFFYFVFTLSLHFNFFTKYFLQCTQTAKLPDGVQAFFITINTQFSLLMYILLQGPRCFSQRPNF